MAGDDRVMLSIADIRVLSFGVTMLVDLGDEFAFDTLDGNSFDIITEITSTGTTASFRVMM